MKLDYKILCFEDIVLKTKHYGGKKNLIFFVNTFVSIIYVMVF
jgi:hypothetical protein